MTDEKFMILRNDSISIKSPKQTKNIYTSIKKESPQSVQ